MDTRIHQHEGALDVSGLILLQWMRPCDACAQLSRRVNTRWGGELWRRRAGIPTLVISGRHASETVGANLVAHMAPGVKTHLVLGGTRARLVALDQLPIRRFRSRAAVPCGMDRHAPPSTNMCAEATCGLCTPYSTETVMLGSPPREPPKPLGPVLCCCTMQSPFNQQRGWCQDVARHP